MRWIVFVAAAAALAACSLTNEKPPVTAAPEVEPDLTRSDCYTVVLYDGFDIAPAPAQIAPEHAAFLGEWRFGAWDGEWCHDLIVTEIAADGQVTLMDLHAPHEPWGQPASAFKRTARIDPEGVLRFRHGVTNRAYRLDPRGRLVAERTFGNTVYTAELRRPGPPLPRPRPEGLAAAAAAASEG
ncbi:MAG: hypothetical protein AAFR52_02600 [Pseudomonadota bacterium]